MANSEPMKPDENVEEYLARLEREQPELAEQCEILARRMVYGDGVGAKMLIGKPGEL